MPTNSFDHYPMSWKPDKDLLKRPVYQSLAALLEQDIANGFLVPGTKLPPQRELADFLDLNFTTITRAYKLAESRGLIYAVTGSGTFVAPNAARSVTITADHRENLIDLAFVASFEQTNTLVTDAIKSVTDKRYVDQLLNYQDPTGIPHQKAAALNWMDRFGIQTSPENVAIVSGAQNALAVVMAALFEPGSKIATDQFTYANFIELARISHVQLVPIPGDAAGMSPGELDRLCRLTAIQGIFLMPSCCNPTTVMMTEERKHELADVIRKHGLVLIEDDIHAFLTADIIPGYGQPLFSMLPDQTVYICGTSKSICSGLRVAYMAFADAFRDKIIQAVFNINVKTSSFDAEVITELITSGQVQQIVLEKKRLAEEANKIYRRYFSFDPTTEHPLSFYRWLQIPGHHSATQLESDLKERGVRVFHSDRFLNASTSADKYLRVGLSSTDTLEELEIGLKILKEYLDG